MTPNLPCNPGLRGPPFEFDETCSNASKSLNGPALPFRPVVNVPAGRCSTRKTCYPWRRAPSRRRESSRASAPPAAVAILHSTACGTDRRNAQATKRNWRRNGLSFCRRQQQQPRPTGRRVRVSSPEAGGRKEGHAGKHGRMPCPQQHIAAECGDVLDVMRAVKPCVNRGAAGSTPANPIAPRRRAAARQIWRRGRTLYAVADLPAAALLFSWSCQESPLASDFAADRELTSPFSSPPSSITIFP